MPRIQGPPMGRQVKLNHCWINAAHFVLQYTHSAPPSIDDLISSYGGGATAAGMSSGSASSSTAGSMAGSTAATVPTVPSTATTAAGSSATAGQQTTQTASTTAGTTHMKGAGKPSTILNAYTGETNRATAEVKSSADADARRTAILDALNENVPLVAQISSPQLDAVRWKHAICIIAFNELTDDVIYADPAQGPQFEATVHLSNFFQYAFPYKRQYQPTDKMAADLNTQGAFDVFAKCDLLIAYRRVAGVALAAGTSSAASTAQVATGTPASTQAGTLTTAQQQALSAKPAAGSRRPGSSGVGTGTAAGSGSGGAGSKPVRHKP